MITKSVLVVVALKEEAELLLHKYNLDVIYTGVGKVNATYALLKELSNRKSVNKLPDLVLNFGTAGSHYLKKGNLFVVNQFIQRDMDVRPLGFKLGVTPFETYPELLSFKYNDIFLTDLICATGDNFETQSTNLKYDLVDMESYALAKVCYFEKIKFLSVKYVSDNANDSAADDWKSNVALGEELFLQWYKNHF
jgi:adenosylhomocysteine nucleosidase